MPRSQGNITVWEFKSQHHPVARVNLVSKAALDAKLQIVITAQKKKKKKQSTKNVLWTWNTVNFIIPVQFVCFFYSSGKQGMI